MPYCSPNASFTLVWYNGGFNHCFIDTVKALALAATMGICGFLELRMYRRYGTKLDHRLLKPVPKLYIIQMLLSFVVCLSQPVRLILQVLDPPVYGYSILLNSVGLIVWSVSMALVYIERNYDLPVAPAGRGHGISLVVFWCAALLCDTLELINVRSPSWWFYVSTSLDGCLLLLWFLQYVCEVGLVVIGCCAPGIVTIAVRKQFIYQQMDENTTEKQLNDYGAVSEDSSPVHHEDCSAECAQSIQELRKGLSSGDIVTKFCEIPRMVKSEGEDIMKLSTSASKLPGNERLNRYCNVLPYDYNRVKLQHNTSKLMENDPFQTPIRNSDTDYINASYVNVRIPRLGLESKFIASQGPKPETLAHFWRMIFEQNVHVIVMLTGIMEGKVKKCEEYYPDALGKSIELENGDITVTCSDVSTPSKSYTIRQFLLVYKLPSTVPEDPQLITTRYVSHFEFHGWPDHGAPKETKKVLSFWRSVREKYLEHHRPTAASLPPLLVHCSAGIGRTGVYILMDTLIIQMEADLPAKPLAVVRQMRQQRMGMVQTEDQFVFACRAALDHFEGKWRRATL